jgi:hypothetical protein
MGPLEHRVLKALRSHADILAAMNSGDREWAKVNPYHARKDMLLADVEFEETFDSCLRVLKAHGLYKEVDGESWVKMEAADYPGAK